MRARESGTTLLCQPLSARYFTRAAWGRASHEPLGSPVRYFSRISACWIWVARSELMLCWPLFFHDALRLWWPCLADLLVVLVAAGAYPANSTMATLTITSFLMAKRKQPTSKKESLGRTAWNETLEPGTNLKEHLFRVHYHPMIGCRRASSLLCSSRLPKCNGISVFWFLAAIYPIFTDTVDGL